MRVHPGEAISVSGIPWPATSAHVPQPFQLSVDSTGNLYILDGTFLVKKVSATDHTITMVTGGTGRNILPGTFDFAGGDLAMTVDANDNLFIVYLSNNGARAVKITPSGATTDIDWIVSVPNDANSIVVDSGRARSAGILRAH